MSYPSIAHSIDVELCFLCTVGVQEELVAVVLRHLPHGAQPTRLPRPDVAVERSLGRQTGHVHGAVFKRRRVVGQRRTVDVQRFPALPHNAAITCSETYR